MNRFTRRTVVGSLVSALAGRPSRIFAEGDIEPVRTQLYRMLEVLPDRSGRSTREFPTTLFIDGTKPGWQQHNALESDHFQTGTATHIDPEEWIEFLGFAVDDIEASIFQQSSEGTLRIIKGQFLFDRIEEVCAVLTSNGYQTVDSGELFSQMRRISSSNALLSRFPTIYSIQVGSYDSIAFLDNQMLVIASTPELVQRVRDAERKRVPYMTFGPGIGGVLRNEPEAVYEAVIVPASSIPDDTNGPHLLTAAVLTSFPENDTRSASTAKAITAARAKNTAITSLSWRQPGHLVTDDEVNAYANHIKGQFESAISSKTGVLFSEYLTIPEITLDHGSVTLNLLPVESYTLYEITDMAIANDLGFLSPG